MKNNKSRLPLIFSSSILLFAILGIFILSVLIPDSVMITEGEKTQSFVPDGSSWLLRVEEEQGSEVWQNSADKIDVVQNSDHNATIYFCGVLPFKTVEITTTSTRFVQLGGDAIGISLNIDGILVVGLTDINTSSGISSPAKIAGLKKGDIIRKIDGKLVNDVSDVAEIIRVADKEITVEGISGNDEKVWKISPVKDENSQTKIGLWIRDAVSGIGTLTYVSKNGFGALGHPISDIDTGNFVDSTSGSIYDASIVGVDKGEKGVPGSLVGIFTQKKLGSISKNTSCGVFGNFDNASESTLVPIAKKEEIRCTEASILCDVGNGVEEFETEIVRVILSGDASKGMVIHITDENLIQKTGGIVQGMSGSPILQNGKLIGAVTHVFVNDPTRGYGIFIENMLAEAEKIK